MAHPQNRQIRGAIQEAHDPLGYWLEQERAPGLDESLSAPYAAEPDPLPGGWWLLPVMVMALPVWGLIIWLLVRA